MQRYGNFVRSKLMTVVALAGISLLSFVGVQVARPQVAGASTDTGFTFPFSGTPHYESLAPTEITNPSQLNQPVGQQAADQIATQLGLSPADAFTQEQYQEFTSGGGEGGNPADAQLVDDSVAILTNTVGRPLYSNVNGQSTPSVLASYGLFVNPDGMLESVANEDAATRQVNTVIAPGGYMGKWMKANGAKRTLAALYTSPYPLETVYGFISQQISGAAQLVTNKSGGVTSEVGMSMAPALWLVNFILIYLLNPSLAAYMPAHWAPIPANVANAILPPNSSGQVLYSEYASYLPQ
jgi:hypothetical protein